MDSDGPSGPVWQRDKVLENWAESVEYAQATLLSSSTKKRVTFLQDEILPLVKSADLTLERASDIFKLLATTYPRYADGQSRDVVEEILRDLVRADELRGAEGGKKLGISDKILGWISNEAGRLAKSIPDVHASSNVFVLLSWSCGIFTTYIQTAPGFGTDPNALPWKTSIMTVATLFDILSASVKRPAILHGALVRVRRALRSAGLDKLQTVIDTLLAQLKLSSTPLRIFPLLGVAIAVLIRLKRIETEPVARLSDNARKEILAAFSSHILLSKTAVPPHVSSSLEDFIKTFVSQDDINQTIVPTLEKAILRSAENSLPVLVDLFNAYPKALDADILKRVVTQVVNSAKSTNAQTRTLSISLFKAVITPSNEELLAVAVKELFSLPQAGKSAGPEHRVALYSMIAHVAPSAPTSVEAEGEKSLSYTLLKSATPLLSKETHEGAAATLASTLPPHITAVLLGGLAVPAETSTLIVKEMGNAKPVIKKAFCALVGSVFFPDAKQTDRVDWSEKPKALEFAQALVPGLEKSLTAVSANPINAAAGALEGYVAIAVLLGPLAKTGKFATVASKNAVLTSFVGTPTKPFFLLWDKVYGKISASLDEEWLLHASTVALTHYKAELNKNESLRSQLGLIFVHLALEGSTTQLRTSLYKSIQELANIDPKLTNRVVREGVNAFLLKHSSTSKTPAPLASLDEESTPKPFSKHARLSTLLSSAVSFNLPEDAEPTVPLQERESLVVDLLVQAHHKMICGTSKQTWIDLCQKAGADPRQVTENHVDKLMNLVLEASTINSTGFVDASQSAVSTLVFVAPETVLPRILGQIRLDLDYQAISSLTDDDLGIWRTPEGTTYVDVLGLSKEKQVGKGKEQELAKWEAEVRKSIASKKGAAPVTLTKQQQVLVDKQLEEETKVRTRVVGILASVRRGMGFIRALASSGSEAIRIELGGMAGLLLQSALSERGVALIGDEAYETYLKLADCTSERLGTLRRWIGITSLRSLKVEAIPEELQAEPLQDAVTRVLYRLQTLSDQATFDVATFSYAYPLLGQVLVQGGISTTDDDETLEQIMLTLTIIRAHAGEFSNTAYPRVEAMQNILQAIKQQPRLAKEASTTLVDVGEAVQATATKEEVNILLRGTLAQETNVRSSCLQTLQPFDLTDLDWSLELLIACHDEDEQNSRLARHLWDDNGLDIPENSSESLLDYLGHENAYVRSATAEAITESVDRWPQSIHAVVSALQGLYREKSKLLAPELDQYGMVIAQTLDRADPWPTRLAISRTFELLSPVFTDEEVEPFFTFLIKDEALGDREGQVRQGVLRAGTSVIDAHGARHITALISVFEDHLRQPSPATETGDYIKEAVIILFGRVARHLDSKDSRIPSIIERLTEALKTPSEQVQIAVSDCISPLVKLIRPTLTELVDGLFTDLLEGPKYAVRRGAAYGLAGVLKGTGISGIKEFNIVNRLRVAAEDKKKPEARQGVMFAFETLSSALGRLFEPYVTYLLPLLLAMFGDASTDVREATQDAAKVIMGNLSAYGVKLILPSLLEGLDEKQWRTKKGSIELLGMMAYCSPRQLSVSLPIVIPRLTGVLTDSHAQVRTAANKSLKQFGEVISNPEIQNLVPVLLKALVDPGKTTTALSSLLKTSFMHYIDHSSLALVIPIIERGLRERGADVKKKAVQIVGNLASLTESKDFIPYLSELLPLVHTVLVDPVPEARATAAKALGTLVERLGEINFPDLVPGLLRTLKTDTSGVDRQGAAQGLSEVLSGLGMERLEGLLPDILANAQSPRPTVREGFMSLLVFLPATFGTRFQPHLPKIITPILSGLSDTEEYVREAAMKAGRMVVTNYSSKAIDLLLPELERGMFDSGWRIRQSSITLVGELLFKVSGISGKTSDDADEEEGGENEAEAAAATESSKRALLEVLGQERRDRVLAALYLVRQDGVAVVRQTSIQIWKALVQNTPRTVREVLPELLNTIIYLVSGDEFEQQETATRTTGELCRKFGERIVGEIMPLIKDKATSSDPRTRQGVCQVVSDIMENTTDTQRESYEDDIISIVRVSLVDDEPNVRSAAAQAFDILQEHIGNKAIDQTIPTLLEALRQPGKGSGTALDALREVMSVRASTVFPVLIPTLTATPMTLFNCRALSALVTVAGNALSRRLTVILNSLVKSIEEDDREDLQEALQETLTSLLSSVSDAEGLNTLMLILLGWVKHENPKRRVSACRFFANFCEVSEMDASLYRVDWIRQLVPSLEDSQVEVHTAAWEALDAFVKSVPKDEYEPLVVPLRRSIESTGGPGQTVPGFSLPKGVSPFVPIIIAGLTTGSNEQREQAAYAIGDLVERTEESAIKPFVVPFTGPLIRVATQATAYPPGVKTAILSALMSMLERIPVFVKPFFPQLQRTFVKSASDPSSVNVRSKAAQALGVLMRHQPRVDPVITELITGAKSSDDAIGSSLIQALANVVKNASQNVGEKARESCIELLSEVFRESHGDHFCASVGSLVVALSDHPEPLAPLVKAHLVAGTDQTTLSIQVIRSVITHDDDEEYEGPNLFQKLGILRPVAQKVKEGITSDKPSVARASREARDILKSLEDESLEGVL